MRARPIDAAEGYRLFRRNHGDIGLQEINEYLRGRDLRPVSPRMMTHFGRLLDHDVETYIPINRFDIAIAGDYAWTEDLRSLYGEEDTATRGILTSRLQTFDVLVESIGAASASVVLEDRPPLGAPAVLELTATGISRVCTVTRYDPVSGLAHLLFDPFGSIPVADHAEARATFTFQFDASTESLVAVSTVIHQLNRLIASADTERRNLTRVERLTMSSPLEVIIAGGAVLSFVTIIVNRLVVIRKDWFEGTKAKYEIEGIQLDNDQKKRTAQLESDEQIREELRSELRSSDETPLLNQLAPNPSYIGEPNSPQRARLVSTSLEALELPIDSAAQEQVDNQETA